MHRSLLAVYAVVAVVAVVVWVGGWHLSNVIAFPVALLPPVSAFAVRVLLR